MIPTAIEVSDGDISSHRYLFDGLDLTAARQIDVGYPNIAHNLSDDTDTRLRYGGIEILGQE